MKRFASALLVFALLLCAAGCSGKGGNKSNDSSKGNNGSNISSNTDVNWPYWCYNHFCRCASRLQS